MNTAAPRHKDRTMLVSQFNEIVGRQVKSFREEYGKSQRDLAEACGMAQSMISHVEDGRGVSLPTLVLIAYELDVAIDQLIPTDAIDALRGDA